MTDYFALLQQPRRPWLDLAELEEKYRELARATHPDTASQNDQTSFAEVNAAYRTLRDPKLRLQHLLALEGKSPTPNSSDLPADLVDLFMNIAPAIKRGDKQEIDTLMQDVDQLLDKATEQLRQLSEHWSSESISEAEALYRRLAFLSRWREGTQA